MLRFIVLPRCVCEIMKRQRPMRPEEQRKAKHDERSYAASSATLSVRSTGIYARHRTHQTALDEHRSFNAVVEAFFKTIKAEVLWQQSWPSRRAAEIAIFQYINGFYNPRRRHSALRWKSPMAFEAQAA